MPVNNSGPVNFYNQSTPNVAPKTTTTIMTTDVGGSVPHVAGFGPLDLGTITVNGKSLGDDYRDAVINIFVQRTNMGSSTLTMQLADPTRTLINTIFKQGATLLLDGLSYTLVQFMKASDQIQLVFESTSVYKLRNTWGQTATHTTTDVTGFIDSLARPLGITVVGPDYATVWKKITNQALKPIVLARGTTADANENSWVCMSRIAAQIGWRLWESAGVIYFGPDEYWLGNLTAGAPPVNKALGTIGTKMVYIREFTTEVQLIDYDWDYGKPFAQASVTCMLDSFSYNIGEVVNVQNIGPGSGYWLVAGMQRDLFLPQATLTLQVPMKFSEYTNPTSIPLKTGFPLTPLTKALIK
jgi:hypothetical protein